VALVAVDSEDITVDATSGGVPLTAAKATASRNVRAHCVVETAQIRVKTDAAVTLTASAKGHVKDVGDEFYISGQPDLVSFRAIRTGGTSGKLVVTYEGAGA